MPERTIFLVDDSELILSMVSAALQTAGYKVRALARWEALNAELEHSKPDMILMDINMPEMTGDSALSFFREARGLEDVPIYLYSDIDIRALERRAEACGADGFISKGWGIERLMSAVEQVLAGD